MDQNTAMKRLCVALLLLVACNKKSAPGLSQDPALLVGSWIYVEDNAIAPATTLTKTMTFTANGEVYIHHNDSTDGAPNLFLMPTPLPAPVTDTFPYTTKLVVLSGWATGSYDGLIIKGFYYQWRVGGDTLYITSPPSPLAGQLAWYIRQP